MTAASLRRATLVALSFALLALGACGGGDDETAPATLSDRLLPAKSFPGYRLHRRFDWSNSIDLVAQGLPLGENSSPSHSVDVVDDSGFDAAVGESFAKREGGDMSVVAIKLSSDDGANDLSKYVFQEALKQPCYGSCSEIASEFRVTGIPGARGVQQLPQKRPGPNAPPPFVAYGVGFTVGPYLYLVGGGGPPGSLEKSFVLSRAHELYDRVKRR